MNSLLRQRPVGSGPEYRKWLESLIPSHCWWSFTFFTSEDFMYRQRWERDNPILKMELMSIAHNNDPLYGYRLLTKNATNFSSQNSWYRYERKIKMTGQDEYNSWIIQVHPTAENPEKPLDTFHHEFEVMMPEEFLNDKIFMDINLGRR